MQGASLIIQTREGEKRGVACKWGRPRIGTEVLSGFNRQEREGHGREAEAGADPVSLSRKGKLDPNCTFSLD